MSDPRKNSCGCAAANGEIKQTNKLWLSSDMIPGYVSSGEMFPEKTHDDTRNKRHFSNGYCRVAELEEKLLRQIFTMHDLRPITTSKWERKTRQTETE